VRPSLKEGGRSYGISRRKRRKTTLRAEPVRRKEIPYSPGRDPQHPAGCASRKRRHGDNENGERKGVAQKDLDEKLEKGGRAPKMR